MIGTKLAHYEMIARLGQGGMGEVYKATDTRLSRVVAIKILHPEFSNLEQFQQRFEREAQTIASLNHPHVCTLYDVGKEDNVHFLVMEFLEGETLAARLERGALPLDEALAVAIQISDALDKAHSLGVTHRDLKPANIMLTASGAKLMDFGLAKRQSPQISGSVSMAATAAPNLTQHGALIGTVAYMAPEQIEGEEADPRTDIFALGVVLYEMITGTKAFAGKSQAGLMASILHDQPPPLTTVQVLTPPALQRVVEICLAKNPRDRWQTTHDLTLQLKWIAQGGSQAGLAAAPTTRPRKWREIAAWTIAAAGLVAAAALATANLWKGPADASVLRFFIYPKDGTTFGPEGAGIRPFPAISPDGKRMVFLAQKPREPVYLWVRQLDSLDAEPLIGTEDARIPFWSPDSRSVAFTSGGKLKRIDVSGGPVQVLADIPTADRAAEGSWNRNGTIVFSHGMGNPDSNSGILRVSDTGGIPTVIIAPDKERKEQALQAPYFLPDGKHFVYLAIGPSVLYAGSLDSTEPPKQLVQADSHAIYSNGFLLFVRRGNLMALKFDPTTLTTSGDPLPVAEKVRTNVSNGRSAFSVSDNGTLVYRTGSNFNQDDDARLVWFDREGKVGAAINQIGDNRIPYLSPDEKQVIVKRSTSSGGNAADLWTIDLVRATNTRITFGNGNAFPGGWSPDGMRVLYRAESDGKYALYAKSATGVGSEELLLKFERMINGVFDWSRDNKYIAFTISDPKTGVDLWTLPLFGDRKPTAFVDTPFDQSNPRFSPDGRWIAYESNESGVSQIYAQPFPPTGQRIQVSVDGGYQPRWRGDGKELFFLLNGEVLAADVKTPTSNIEAGTPHRLFLIPQGSRDFSVSRDGQRFLISVPISAMSEFATDNQPLVVVTNWTTTLKK
jgi:Tol biopolymer transport system component